MRLILAAKSLRCSWLKDIKESRAWLETLRVYRTVECAVTAPLQQGTHPPTHPTPAHSTSFKPPRSPQSTHPLTHPPSPGMREAEFRLSQNLGNLNIEAVAGETPAERACMWITLKVKERKESVPPTHPLTHPPTHPLPVEGKNPPPRNEPLSPNPPTQPTHPPTHLPLYRPSSPSGK